MSLNVIRENKMLAKISEFTIFKCLSITETMLTGPSLAWSQKQIEAISVPFCIKGHIGKWIIEEEELY